MSSLLIQCMCTRSWFREINWRRGYMNWMVLVWCDLVAVTSWYSWQSAFYPFSTMAVCSQFAHSPFDGLSQKSFLLLLLWFRRFCLNSTVPYNLWQSGTVCLQVIKDKLWVISMVFLTAACTYYWSWNRTKISCSLNQLSCSVFCSHFCLVGELYCQSNISDLQDYQHAEGNMWMKGRWKIRMY